MFYMLILPKLCVWLNWQMKTAPKTQLYCISWGIQAYHWNLSLNYSGPEYLDYYKDVGNSVTVGAYSCLKHIVLSSNTINCNFFSC